MLSSGKKKFTFIAFTLCCLIIFVDAADDNKAGEIEKICNNKQTCRECIRSPGCSWCQDVVYKETRCFLNLASLENCKEVISLKSNLNMLQNNAFTQDNVDKKRANQNKNIVQIRPQRVQLDLRINQPYRLKINYTRADDYPIDLYFLMDLSNSMRDDKNKLSQLGNILAKTMRKMTTDFRLGFGSFVDKTVLPYAPKLTKAYSFHNHMPLNTNAEEFSSKVKEASIAGNLDDPEGGFDALMQAVACRKEIGWRDQARRLLVFATDAPFHYAGDGKLGGIIEPNDCECHLDAKGYSYTKANEQDYPSIGQINQKVKENSINVIFAVTDDYLNLYNKLSEVIYGSTSAKLSIDSSNVVDIVEDEYKKISSSIQMIHNATNHVKITFHSACKNEIERETSKCNDIQIGDNIKFAAEITVNSCPADPNKWTQFIQIKPTDIMESLIIEVRMLCSCDCENPSVIEKNSPRCHDRGTFMCGICDCGNLYKGKNCECDAESYSVNNATIGCRPANTPNIETLCSGRGLCICGECSCDSDLYDGKYCECDKFSCHRKNEKLCSGPDHGTCECGQCVCTPGWKGDACDCMVSQETCMSPNSTEICSGNGECKCGECKCNSTESGRYSGKHCEHCPTCSGRCQKLKSCVQCQIFGNGPLKDTCKTYCTKFTSSSVDKIILDENKGEHLCMFFDEDECKFTFKYAEEKGELIAVEAQLELECPPKQLVWKIVFSVIGATVLVGLATLLLWKLITTIHDRREFTRFEKERKEANWGTGESPIYKQATTTIYNPQFESKK